MIKILNLRTAKMTPEQLNMMANKINEIVQEINKMGCHMSSVESTVNNIAGTVSDGKRWSHVVSDNTGVHFQCGELKVTEGLRVLETTTSNLESECGKQSNYYKLSKKERVI